MTLLLEIGNSTFKLCRADADAFHVTRFSDEDACLRALSVSGERVHIAHVARARGAALASALPQRGRGALLTHDDVRAFLDGAYDAPDTLGMDRVLHLRGLDGDGVVVSCGTAITVDALVHGRPRFGAILPGLLTATRGLHA